MPVGRCELFYPARQALACRVRRESDRKAHTKVFSVRRLPGSWGNLLDIVSKDVSYVPFFPPPYWPVRYGRSLSPRPSRGRGIGTRAKLRLLRNLRDLGAKH